MGSSKDELLFDIWELEKKLEYIQRNYPKVFDEANKYYKREVIENGK